MSINLQKNQRILLDSSKYDLSKLTIGLGWEIKKGTKGLLGFLKKGEIEFDLDALALLLGKNKKLCHEDDVIYFGNLSSSDGSVVHSGDNLTGNNRGDSEQITIDLDKIPERYHQISFAVIIHNAAERDQHFNLLDHAFVRAVDAEGNEIARFELSHNEIYKSQVSMLMGDLHQNEGQWEFKAVGTPLGLERISSIAAKYA